MPCSKHATYLINAFGHAKETLNGAAILRARGRLIDYIAELEGQIETHGIPVLLYKADLVHTQLELWRGASGFYYLVHNDVRINELTYHEAAQAFGMRLIDAIGEKTP